MSEGKKTRLYYQESPEYKTDQARVQRVKAEAEQARKRRSRQSIEPDLRTALTFELPRSKPSLVNQPRPVALEPKPEAAPKPVESHAMPQSVLDERYGNNGWSHTPSGDWIIPTPGSRAHADYIQRQADLTAQGWVHIGSRKYLEPPPKGHEAYQRYQDLQAEAETRAQDINPSQLSTQALDPKVQAQLESVLGKLPTIQIAIGVDADVQSQAIQAVAFTSGSTIAFRFGKFDPQSLEGFKLLLHEATHVKQQASGQVSSGGIDPDMNLERAAQQQADNLSQIPEIPQITHLEGKDISRDQHIANYSQQLIDRHGELGPVKDRFEQMRDFFWQVPEDYQSRSRFNFMSGFSLASHEFLQLDQHLRTFRAGGLEMKQQLEAERNAKLEQQQAITDTRAATTFQTEVPRVEKSEFKNFNLEKTEKSSLPSALRQNVVNQYQHQFEQSSFTPQWKTLTNAVWGETNLNSSIEQSPIPRMDHNVFSSGNITKASPKNQEFTATPITTSSLPIKNTNSSRQRVQRATDFKVESNAVQRSSQVIQRFSLMEEASNFVAGVIPGYKTLCSALGKDLITGKKVDQNPNAIMDALADLVPGPIKDMVKALKESNAIPKAWAWFKGELGKINLAATWQQVKKAIGDVGLFNVGETKDKVVKAIMAPVNQVKSLVGGSIRKLAEIALEAIAAVAGGSGKQLIDSLKGAGDVITEVIKNPGKFVKNLISALTGGVKNFAANAKTHLSNGLGSWLSGESGLPFPANLDVKGVFTLALTVLGVTYQNFRKSLVLKLGEEKTKIAEDKVDMVKNIASKGMHVAEGMDKEQGTVKTEVVEGAKDFVKTSVIQAAVTKLISMFIPGGGIIQLFMTAFDMVKFVMNEGSRIASLAASIMGGVANIAQGNITGAVGKVEQSLAKAIPLALSFLSRIFRVSGLGKKIETVVKKVRGKIEAVTKRVIDKVAAQVAKIAGALTGKGKTDQTTAANQDTKGKTQEPTNPSGFKSKADQEKHHLALAKQASSELKAQVPKKSNYANVRSYLEGQKASVEQKYNKMLSKDFETGKRQVTMKISFSSAKDDAKDNDVDYNIWIGPNDTTLKDSVGSDGGTIKAHTYSQMNGKLAVTSFDFKGPKTFGATGTAKTTEPPPNIFMTTSTVEAAALALSKHLGQPITVTAELSGGNNAKLIMKAGDSLAATLIITPSIIIAELNPAMTKIANKARQSNVGRSQRVTQAINAEKNPKFQSVMVGAGWFAIASYAGDKYKNGVPSHIAVSSNPEPWSQRDRTAAIGQLADFEQEDDLNVPGFSKQAMDFVVKSTRKGAYMPTGAFADAIAFTAFKKGMPVYNGSVGQVEDKTATQAKATPWADGKYKARAMVNGKYWYTHQINVAVGTGDPNKVKDSDGNDIPESSGEAAINKTYKFPAGNLLVLGAGPTAAWVTARALQQGVESVDWTPSTFKSLSEGTKEERAARDFNDGKHKGDVAGFNNTAKLERTGDVIAPSGNGVRPVDSHINIEPSWKIVNIKTVAGGFEVTFAVPAGANILQDPKAPKGAMFLTKRYSKIIGAMGQQVNGDLIKNAGAMEPVFGEAIKDLNGNPVIGSKGPVKLPKYLKNATGSIRIVGASATSRGLISESAYADAWSESVGNAISEKVIKSKHSANVNAAINLWKTIGFTWGNRKK
jgi:hypothetical protein